jgi:hypothetical protein
MGLLTVVIGVVAAVAVLLIIGGLITVVLRWTFPIAVFSPDSVAAGEGVVAEVFAIIALITLVLIEEIEMAIIGPIATSVRPVIAIIVSARVGAIGIVAGIMVTTPAIAGAARKQQDRRTTTK